MKLWYYRGRSPNFGDDLNPWLWPQMLSYTFDNDDESLFLGIGSILFNRFAPNTKRLVFGAGFGSYSAAPDLHDGSWTVRFVRGPQTARLLKLDPKLALADPAILINQCLPSLRPSGQTVSFMPHWTSMDHGHWDRVCRLAGITLIDPRQSVTATLDQLLRTRMLITEAMHGAIVADALRIPFVPVRTLHLEHQMKWQDWAASLDLTLRPQTLFPSSMAEARLSRFRWLRGMGRVLGRFRSIKAADTAFIYSSAQKLRQISKVEPQLSPPSSMERVTTRLLEECRSFERDYNQGGAVPLKYGTSGRFG